jgi:hypothetical protein
MTPEEMKEILDRLGIKEGVPHQMKEKGELKIPQATQLVTLLTDMKTLFEKELAEEEAKIVALREQMVKKEKGGCNG